MLTKICRYTISFILILTVCSVGLLCSAAILEDNFDDTQKRIVMGNANASGLLSLTTAINNWPYANYTDSTSGVDYFVRGNKYNSTAVSSSSVSLNLPFFLSGFDSLNIEFAMACNSGSLNAFRWYIENLKFYIVKDSVATQVAFKDIGDIYLSQVNIPTTTSSTNKVDYYGNIYQIKITEPIDYLRITFTGTEYGSSWKYLIWGFAGIYVNATSDALVSIQQQVIDISSKVDDLKQAIEDAASSIGGIATNQGEILDSVNDIKELNNTLVQNQEIIMYSTDDDQIVMNALNERFDDVKDALQEYKDILEQYHNPPSVGDVTNIINQGVPQDYDPSIVAPVLTAVFDNSLITTILIAVIALMIMSYVLFGKKG